MIRGSTHSRWIASVSTALAVVGCVVAPFLPTPPAAAATLAGWTGWDTSPTDATRRLAVITPSAATATSTVLVDPTARGQVWQGVGASLTDASVSLLKNNSSAVSMLFDPAAAKGAHLNIVRLPLSSTDFSPTLWTWSQ